MDVIASMGLYIAIRIADRRGELYPYHLRRSNRAGDHVAHYVQFPLMVAKLFVERLAAAQIIVVLKVQTSRKAVSKLGSVPKHAFDPEFVPCGCTAR